MGKAENPLVSTLKIRDLPGGERRNIRAWCMYDWANSAFATSGVAAVLPVYFVLLFKDAVGESGSFLGITFTGSSMWSLAVVMSTGVVALGSPILGVISDRIPIKKALLGLFTGLGALFTVLVFFSAYTPQPWVWLFVVFTLANLGFAGCLVFYNSFLPHLGPRHLLDAISSRGFAFGYAGGGLVLLVHLALILPTRNSDIADLVTRAAIASIGVWWFGWSIWTLRVLPEPPVRRADGDLTVAGTLVMAVRELRRTFRDLARFKVVLIYFGAYLLFNDGLQTTLAIAGAFSADTIGISLAFNMATILIIQIVAIPGAIAFGWLAERISTKRALMVSLAGWIVIVFFGVAIVPLSPSDHEHFDFQLSYRQNANLYVIDIAPSLPDSGFELRWGNEEWVLTEGAALKPAAVRSLTEAVRGSDEVAYSLSVQGGDLDGQSAVGPAHPSVLGPGPIDWWPSAVRTALWAPLGLDAGYQWLLLGVSVGLVIGGSQALARSLFAQITPQSRSGEFFSFFGSMSRASSVLGPTLYIVATAVFDTRVAVTAILAIIVAGTIALCWVDVAEGSRVAEAENRRSGNGALNNDVSTPDFPSPDVGGQ